MAVSKKKDHTSIVLRINGELLLRVYNRQDEYKKETQHKKNPEGFYLTIPRAVMQVFDELLKKEKELAQVSGELSVFKKYVR